ncbi:ABC-type Fe3+-hydroxamate transport system substrate-binding protein [Desulfitobacterium sp. LBE]|uniref:ABC transporter substrate-binding protein n=1 Tax=Desulfitobacterium sp. LBE TaxID=884086 RepID=UPI001199ED72|nr:ABC transporter substrate-binding protein [Desulfitobacterium sp. LBE]TWH56697.1 ABC-type Fe3+-hydroxamate transport system substrate-binding protein [Desulfitobacterium sp. LBE]
MKVTINQNPNIKETEVIINCCCLDKRLKYLVDYIRQFSFSIKGHIDDKQFYIPLDCVLYIDSVDKKTFFYDEHRVFLCKSSLLELEKMLDNTIFVRISKNCIINLAYLHCVRNADNHRMEAIMSNGERIMVGRAYVERLRSKLEEIQIDPFHLHLSKEISHMYSCSERSVVNMGTIISSLAAPKRVVPLSYGTAELLAALGVSGPMIAVAPAETTLANVLPQYRNLLESIPVLTYQDQGVPTIEELIHLEADLVIGSFYSTKTINMETLKRRQPNINIYIHEGTVPAHATLESTYRDILNLGKLFRVEDIAVQLVEQWRREIACLRRCLTEEGNVRVFVYDSGKAVPRTSAGDTLENDLIHLSGGKNIFHDKKSGYIATDWREIAKGDPEIIIVHQYDDSMTAEEKIAYLRRRSELKGTSAVRNNRFLKLSLMEVFPSAQNTRAIKKMINVFYPNLL